MKKERKNLSSAYEGKRGTEEIKRLILEENNKSSKISKRTSGLQAGILKVPLQRSCLYLSLNTHELRRFAYADGKRIATGLPGT